MEKNGAYQGLSKVNLVGYIPVPLVAEITFLFNFLHLSGLNFPQGTSTAGCDGDQTEILELSQLWGEI